MPAPLAHTTLQAALWFAGEHSVGAAAASAEAVALAKGALGMMTAGKLKAAAGVALAVGLFGGGTAWLARSAAMSDTPRPAAEARATDKADAKKPEPTPAILPPGATSRMGTSQFRHGEAIFFVATVVSLVWRMVSTMSAPWLLSATSRLARSL